MLPPLLALLVGCALIAGALWDAFETIVLPHRVARRFRIARAFYRSTWRPYARIARRIRDETRRESYLSFFGPLSLLFLVGVWAVLLIVGFGLLQWGAGSALNVGDSSVDLPTVLYFSGTTFFTLGLGDVVPRSASARWLAVIEGGTGFGFLALVIGYLPLVYQLFARRETNVSFLDQRAGSPPSACELMRRNVRDGDLSELIRLLRDWETWVADLLESQLSYPSLGFFRSQHENQSWLAALAVILDVSALVLACGANSASRQAAFTFAISRHAVADLTHVLGVPPQLPTSERLDPATAERLLKIANQHNLTASPDQARERLTNIRAVYEPYLASLSRFLLMTLPPWVAAPDAQDNWETTAWDFDSPIALLGPGSPFTKQ